MEFLGLGTKTEGKKEINHAGTVWRRGKIPCLRRLKDKEAWLPCKEAQRALPSGGHSGEPSRSRAAKIEFRI